MTPLAGVHIDISHWTAILYLSLPGDCPDTVAAGTHLFRHKATNSDHALSEFTGTLAQMTRHWELLLLAAAGLPAFAGEADVLDVDVSCKNGRLCSFDVTVRHDDEGWEHYANRWEVLSPDGEVLATRVLAHPHVNEQPFTRSLSNVGIPDGVSEVVVRAHDSVHEYGGEELVVQLPN